MDKNAKNAVDKLLSTPEGAAVSKKRGELEKLANSADGQRVKQMLEHSVGDLSEAIGRSDTGKLESSLKNVLSTDEGARLLAQISELFK